MAINTYWNRRNLFFTSPESYTLDDIEYFEEDPGEIITTTSYRRRYDSGDEGAIAISILHDADDGWFRVVETSDRGELILNEIFDTDVELKSILFSGLANEASLHGFNEAAELAVENFKAYIQERGILFSDKAKKRLEELDREERHEIRPSRN